MSICYCFFSQCVLPTSISVILLYQCCLSLLSSYSHMRLLSLLVIPSIHRSILLCVVWSRWVIAAFSTHVSLPYVRTGRMHWLNTFLFRAIAILDFRMWAFLPKALQPSYILRFTSFILFFSTVVRTCPRWKYISKAPRGMSCRWIGISAAYKLYVTLVFDKYILSPIFFPSSFSSWSVDAKSSPSVAKSTMSSANRRWLMYSPLILSPFPTAIPLPGLKSNGDKP